MDGCDVPLEQVPSLSIKVQEDLVTQPGDITELPTYEKTTYHPEITKGKTGGYAGKK